MVNMETFSLNVHDAVTQSYVNAEVGVVKSKLGCKLKEVVFVVPV